jgi:hypothetical protein
MVARSGGEVNHRFRRDLRRDRPVGQPGAGVARELSRQSETLGGEVDKILEGIRAA